jgi:hypothetical protein
VAGRKSESSSAFFARLRPKFLDWEPPTEEEKARAARARSDAKAAELKRVTDLAAAREAERAAERKLRSERLARQGLTPRRGRPRLVKTR